MDKLNHPNMERIILTEIASTPDGSINWSKLARKLGIDQKNVGEVLKEFVIHKGVNIRRFRN